MASHHARSTSTALYRVFVQPCLSHQGVPLKRGISIPRLCSPLRSTITQKRAPFSTSDHYRGKYRQPEIRSQKHDSEITARRIYLVDTETNRLDNTLRDTRAVLQDLDLSTHRLVQVTPVEEERQGVIPVCKIVNKRDEYEAARRRKAASKESKRLSTAVSSVKTLELNWAIDGNDLSHRLDKMVQFLREGRKVEVMLASKKAGRKAQPNECAAVLQKIRSVVGEVQGAKEVAAEGMIGRVFTLYLQGPVPKTAAKGEQSSQTAPEADHIVPQARRAGSPPTRGTKAQEPQVQNV